MIQIENLHKKFGKNEVLSGVDLMIKGGGIFAVLGPNGSGKTTLIKSILGMVVPNRGTIKVDGKSIRKNWKYRQHIDYLPQIANFPGNLKVKELIRMIQDLRQKPSEADKLIAIFGLETFLDKKLGTLSGGTKQKVNIVLTFMFDSPLIILDEPTNRPGSRLPTPPQRTDHGGKEQGQNLSGDLAYHAIRRRDGRRNRVSVGR